MHTCLRFAFVVSTVISFCLQKADAQNTSPYWSLSGNSTASTSSKLGTTNAIPLRLMTNNKERLRIDTIGRILIGTTTATSRLSVNAASGTSPFLAQVGGATKLYGSSGGGLSIGSGATPPSNGLYVNGTVAVGTTTPASGYKLHVVGKGRFTYGLIVPSGDIQVTNPSGLAMTIKGKTGGIKVQSVDESLGYPVATGIGVESYGGIGIKGSGNYGVQGFGSNEGTNIGVYGHGENTGTGVKGESPDGTGVVAKGGSLGIEAQGGEVGVDASGFFGIVTSGEIYGIKGYASAPDGYGGEFSSAGSGLHASAGSAAGSYAAVFSGNVYASGVFQSSDKNLKQNVQEFKDAMSLIGKLKPRNYEFKTDAKLAALHLPKGLHYGLIAQDVEEILPNLVTEVHQNLNATKDYLKASRSDSTKAKGINELKKEVTAAEILTTKAVNYTELIPIVIKGMQEQQAEMEAKDKRIAALENDLTELRQMVLELINGNAGTLTSMSGYLEQNTPNPVNGTTTIRYRIPEGSTSARVNITNAKGQLVQTINVSRGTGQLNINTSSLAAGTYNYTLLADGKQVASKRLIVSR